MEMHCERTHHAPRWRPEATAPRSNFFIDLPPPADGFSLPVALPIDPYPTGGNHFGDANVLLIRSAQIHAVAAPVPEPGTLSLMAIGGLLAGIRRRRRRR
jgi:hypothetical protein